MWPRICHSFVSAPRPSAVVSRYAILCISFVLLLWQAWLFAHLPAHYPYDRYGGFVVPLLLLLNTLAFGFHWSQAAMIALRLIAWAWLFAGMFYIFYLSRVWFPLH